ncbi:hypothetical protein LJB96_03225 [Methanobrevibacter sp. OttesenSCG-928-K11]|nr:hypothetical protein [Methanobrevibacter sp. OttesenSCG-928-K11]MDL2270775.1 hypothetical protein [Methanobrevibacter sp. OttesenSCG-928-I08]
MMDLQTPITINTEDTFKTIFSKYGAYALDKQDNLANAIGELEGDLDIDEGTLAFNNDLKFDIQILGFYSEEFNQWSWAWDNENIGFNEDLILSSEKIKEIGDEFEIKEFSTPVFEIDFDECHAMIMIASSLLDDSGYYVADVDDLKIFLSINSDKVKEDNSSEKFRLIFNSFQKNYDVYTKLAFEGYTKLKGYDFKERDDFSLAKIGEDRVIASFSERGKLMGIQLLTAD